MIRRIDQLEVDGVEPGAGADTTSRDESQFDGWLNLVTSLLPAALRESGIRDEIESHLRERVRDLMLAGKKEEAAIHQAVGEFGDAATLARRYAEVTYTHRRRRRMQSILTGLGVLAVAGTTWLVADNAISSAPPPSVFQSAEAPALPEAFSTRNVTVDSPTTLVTVFNAMREASDDRLVVRWGALGEAGFERETEIETIVGDLPFDGMLRELRTVLGGHQGERLDWRYTDGRIEVATRYYFDQRERTLVRYDISEIRNYGVASDEDVQSLLTTFTSPEDWESNGGDLARMQLVSDHLFIEAPPRIHQKVEWLLNELRAKKAAAAPGAERAGETTSAALQSGDAVAIEVWDVYVPGEMTRIERIVERDGVLRFPAPFGLVKAQGRSFDEIEEELTLRMSEFVNEPRLSLFTPVGPKDVATAGRHN